MFLKLIYLFLNSIFYPPCSAHPLTAPYAIHFPPPLSQHGCPQPLPHMTSKLPRPPVSWKLGASSLNEHRPSSLSLFMCMGFHISRCMRSVWWTSVREISGVRLIELLVLLQDCSPPQLLSAFPNSTTGVSCSVHWLSANICIWLFQLLVGSFGGQSW